MGDVTSLAVLYAIAIGAAFGVGFGAVYALYRWAPAPPDLDVETPAPDDLVVILSDRTRRTGLGVAVRRWEVEVWSADGTAGDVVPRDRDPLAVDGRGWASSQAIQPWPRLIVLMIYLASRSASTCFAPYSQTPALVSLRNCVWPAALVVAA